MGEYYAREAGLGDDVAAVARLRCVSDCMVSIPHPYPDDLAATWIRSKQLGFDEGACFCFRIDDASGFTIELHGYGPDNIAVFAGLLPEDINQ